MKRALCIATAVTRLVPRHELVIVWAGSDLENQALETRHAERERSPVEATSLAPYTVAGLPGVFIQRRLWSQ